MQVRGELLQVEDEIADELSGSVESGLSAAVDFLDRMGQRGVAEAGAVAAATDRVNRLVFEKIDAVGSLAGEPGGNGGFLHGEGGRVGDPP